MDFGRHGQLLGASLLLGECLEVLMVHRLFVTAPLIGAILLGAGSASASRHGRFDPPEPFYLALGDSLAFGFSKVRFAEDVQPSGLVDPGVFDTGYVDDFSARLREIRPDIQTVNLSCPGETSATYLQGGCPYRPEPLHVDYTGAQRDAALAFLRAHPGQVSPITFNMGSNDVIPVSALCPTFDETCAEQFLPGVLATLAANLDQTFDEIRQVAPESELIVLEYYNPFFVPFPNSDVFTIQLNDTIRAVATRHGARLADAFTPFNRTGDELTTLCALTLMCIGPTTVFGAPDIHPTDAGYAVIADQFFKASGYARLLDGDDDGDDR
jgi:lysophospholipase L1-like esterase